MLLIKVEFLTDFVRHSLTEAAEVRDRRATSETSGDDHLMFIVYDGGLKQFNIVT